jgi:hypothetical protein
MSERPNGLRPIIDRMPFSKIGQVAMAGLGDP